MLKLPNSKVKGGTPFTASEIVWGVAYMSHGRNYSRNTLFPQAGYKWFKGSGLVCQTCNNKIGVCSCITAHRDPQHPAVAYVTDLGNAQMRRIDLAGRCIDHAVQKGKLQVTEAQYNLFNCQSYGGWVPGGIGCLFWCLIADSYPPFTLTSKQWAKMETQGKLWQPELG